MSNLQDRTIGHQAFSLSGAVPAANYFQVPQDKAESLGLTGPFLYLQVLVPASFMHITSAQLSCHQQAHSVQKMDGNSVAASLQVLLKPGKNYSIHVDAKTTDKNVTRISISNMFSSSSAKVCQPHAGQHAFPVALPVLLTLAAHH